MTVRGKIDAVAIVLQKKATALDVNSPRIINLCCSKEGVLSRRWSLAATSTASAHLETLGRHSGVLILLDVMCGHEQKLTFNGPW